MSQSFHKETRPLLELFGYTPEAISFLGFSNLRGVGFGGLRNIGGVDELLEILSIENDDLFLAKLNAAGIKGFAYPGLIKTREDLRQVIWNEGLEIASKLANDEVYFFDKKRLTALSRLTALPDDMRPYWLYIKGNVELLNHPSIAVVGTRKPTDTGMFLTKYVVSVAGDLNLPIVSGLAYGIDTAAHKAAIDINLPTISILGSGILSPYPAKNAQLAKQIVDQGGVLISEYFPLDGPTKESFVWRNRLQACFASAVIATEWKAVSGTAHTVRFAKILNRSSISISLSRKGSSEDAGKAQFNYELPAQHEDLIHEINRAVLVSAQFEAEKASLFDS